jgi:hypothetical protein
MEWREWYPQDPYVGRMRVKELWVYDDGSMIYRASENCVKWYTPPDWQERLKKAMEASEKVERRERRS